jgi:aminoglycoside phosphotransferase (APT) family kinase protein
MSSSQPARDINAQRQALVAASGGGRDLDAAARTLEAWLGPKLAVSRVRVEGLKGPEGAGVSNETLLFHASCDDGQQASRRSMVLRVAPARIQLFYEPDLRSRYRLLDTLNARALVRVPEMLWFEEDASVLGAPFFIMSRLEGRVPLSSPVYNRTGWLHDASPAERHVLWASAVEELARIHSVPADLVQFCGRPQYGPTGEDQELGYWDAYRDWCATGEVRDDVAAMGEWVRANRPHAGGLGLAWGDARIGNMMFGDDFRLAGVMDWEQASLGGARHDLGWWLLFDDFHSVYQDIPRLDGLGNRQETIELWESLAGERAGDLTWYEAFACYKLALIVLRTMLSSGMTMDAASRRASEHIERARTIAGITRLT